MVVVTACSVVGVVNGGEPKELLLEVMKGDEESYALACAAHILAILVVSAGMYALMRGEAASQPTEQPSDQSHKRPAPHDTGRGPRPRHQRLRHRRLRTQFAGTDKIRHSAGRGSG